MAVRDMMSSILQYVASQHGKSARSVSPIRLAPPSGQRYTHDATGGRPMRAWVLALGLAGGLAGGYLTAGRTVGAAATDRLQDSVMATGAVSLKPGQDADGVWLLDYKTGKLLGTVIDK